MTQMPMDIAGDGSYVRLWMSKVFDIAHDTLFHPKSLFKQVVDNVGYPLPNPTFGGKDSAGIVPDNGLSVHILV